MRSITVPLALVILAVSSAAAVLHKSDVETVLPGGRLRRNLREGGKPLLLLNTTTVAGVSGRVQVTWQDVGYGQPTDWIGLFQADQLLNESLASGESRVSRGAARPTHATSHTCLP